MLQNKDHIMLAVRNVFKGTKSYLNNNQILATLELTEEDK